MTPSALVVDPGSLQIAESTSSGTASFDVKPWRHEPSGQQVSVTLSSGDTAAVSVPVSGR